MSCVFIYKNGKKCNNQSCNRNGCCNMHSSYQNKLMKARALTESITNEENLSMSNGTSADSSAVLEDNNTFNYNGTTFTYILADGIIWFHGKQIVSYIGYDKKSNHVINEHIKPEYIKKLGDFKGPNLGPLKISRGSDSLPLEKNLENFKGNDSLPLKFVFKGNEKNTLYISESGLYQLLATSKLHNPIVKAFQDYLYETILPTIRRTGSFSVVDNNASVVPVSVSVSEKVPISSQIQISLYDKKNVIYVGAIPNTKYYKVGISHDIRTRIASHIKTFDAFQIIYLKECNNNSYVEVLFKNDLRDRNLMESYNDSSETFISTKEYNIDTILSLLDKLVSESDNLFAHNLDLKKIELAIEQEHTSQEREHTKQLELQVMLAMINKFQES